MELNLKKANLSYLDAIKLFENEYPNHGTDLNGFLEKLGFTLEDAVGASWQIEKIITK